MQTRRLAAGLAATALATTAVTLAAGSASAAPTTTWVSTGTRALSLVDATRLGAAPTSAPLRIAVGLAPRRAAQLDALIAAQATPGSPSYEKYLTPADYLAQYAPTAAQAQSVVAYLQGQGFTDVQVAPNRLQVTATGTVGAAQRAFHTSLSRFSQWGRTVTANTLPAQVPASLGGTVSAVLGLDDLQVGLPHRTADSTTPSLAGFYPKQFQTVYDAAGTKTGSATAIAVIAEGDLTSTIKDLRLAEQKQGLPQVPVTVVKTGPASTDTSGADEWDLDTQSSTGLAQTVRRLFVYDATSLSNADLSSAINAFAAANLAKAASASLGECEVGAYSDGSNLVDDAALQEAAAQGQTFFASSGDNGSACPVLPVNGVPGGGLPEVEYPASSTYAVGVGGTTLLAGSDGTYQNEITWNSGGGGLSTFEAAGPWTAGANPAGAVGRGVPDVAADADPNTGALIYVDGTPTQIGGTSLSSPLWLGAWARLQSSHGNKLGAAAPKLYKLYDAAQTGVPTGPAGFHDVVLGSNGAYTALPGYDFTTGIGTPDLTALSKVLK